jgi:hypothetical protein
MNGWDGRRISLFLVVMGGLLGNDRHHSWEEKSQLCDDQESEKKGTKFEELKVKVCSNVKILNHGEDNKMLFKRLKTKCLHNYEDVEEREWLIYLQ